jgi:predicted enzyme related to lactoylglutathione lyase
MAFKNAIASVAVRDLETAIRWYEELLGKPPDSRPMTELAEWRFDGGGWLQVYHLPERAGAGSVTLAVSGLDDLTARLARRGIDTRQRTQEPRIRTLMIVDPDGNHIALAEAADPSFAH